MRRIWVVDDFEFTGSMVSTWMQAYGLSRDERSGRWTFYDRRDDRPFEGRDGGSETLEQSFPDTASLLEYLVGEGDFTESEVLAWTTIHDTPALRELGALLRARIAARV